MRVTELICRHFSFSPQELNAYAQTCPHRYKTYRINKRNSDEKRTISQPSKDLKAVQRFVLTEFLTPKLEVHQTARAYKKGTSILHNAEPHLKNRYLLKMDFQNFFPSILAQDFVNYLVNNRIVDDEDEANLLAKLFFKYENGSLSLSIGSPGSPIISNALLYAFDASVFSLCQNSSTAYTRYSDDITFSTNTRDLLFEWPKKIDAIVNELRSPKLAINTEKTVFSSTKFNRHVTGVTISNEGSASIGHGRKRFLRSRVYRAATLSKKELASLRGHISFANQVEPGLIQKLEKKYPEQMVLIMK